MIDRSAQRLRFIDKLSSRRDIHIGFYGTSLSAERCAFWARTGGTWVAGSESRTFAKKYRGLVRVTNAAKWGSNSEWGVKRLGPRLLRYKPDLVFIEFSVNDADVRR